MMEIERLIRIDDNKLEVPIICKEGMKTKGIIYVDRVLEKKLESESIEQVANVATLPGKRSKKDSVNKNERGNVL